MLSKSFRVGYTPWPTNLSGPTACTLDKLIDSMMLHDPLPLAGVALQHLFLKAITSLVSMTMSNRAGCPQISLFSTGAA